MFIVYVLFIIGLILVVKGGDLFVEASVWIAKITELPEVFIGATIVSIATTFPEVTVSMVAAFEGESSMAVGNAVGSIICNTGLVLGLYNLIRPSEISYKIFTFKGLMLIGYLIILWIMSRQGVIGGWNSVVLLGLLAGYFIFNVMLLKYKRSKRHRTTLPKIIKRSEWISQGIKFIFGISLIIYGANLLVDNGIHIARHWNVPSTIISLTLIALGTSLPEIVTSISALVKGHGGLSIGNVLGANILNITLVLGLSSQVIPLTIERHLNIFDIPIALVMSLLLVVPGVFLRRITRIQGLLLLMGYITYLVMLFSIM